MSARRGAQRGRADGVLSDVPAVDLGEDQDEAIRRGLNKDLDGGFTHLVEVHKKTLATVAGRVAERPQDADDLAAEAFLRAWRALRSYDADRIAALSFRPWLVTIVLNVARNARRDASRRPRVSPLAPANEPTSSARGVDALAVARSERDELVWRLGALAERERIAVVLRHVADLSIPEVAEALGCPEGTARSHVARGLAKLRAAYESDVQTPSRRRATKEGTT